MRSLTKIAVLVLFLLSSASLSVWGHEPHDDIYQLEISPEYSRDRTLYTIVRRDLFRSADGGDSWQRLDRGLDHKGYLQALAISPRDSDILYVSSLGGGVFRSEDAGTTWRRVKGSSSINAEDLLVSPHSSRTVLCAGRTGGVFLTRDAGATWRRVLPEDVRATAMSFFPHRSGTFLVGSSDGVLRMTGDDGETWEELFSCDYCGEISAIAVSPDFEENGKFCFGTASGGFYMTKNAGKGFIAKHRDSMSVKHIQDLLFLPQALNGGVYASTRHEGVYYTASDGWYWFERSKGLTRDPQADHPGHLAMLGEQGGGEYTRPHFNEIRISDDFGNDGTMFLSGFRGLFKSTDGGFTWFEVDTYSRSVVGVSVGPSGGDDNSLAVATYADGAYVSGDGGKSWSSLGRELKYIRDKTEYYLKGPSREHYIELLWPRFYDIKYSPAYMDDRTLYITSLHIPTKVFKLDPEGLKKIELPRPDSGGSLAFSPDFREDGRMFLATQKGSVYASSDRGDSFEHVGRVPISWGHNSISFLVSPDLSSDRTMFFSADTVTGGIYKSVNGGKNWSSLAEGTPLNSLHIIQAAVSPDFAADNTLIAATDKGLFMSDDAGSSWRGTTVTGDTGTEYIEAAAISPSYGEDGIILVSVRGKGIYRSEDRGKSFDPAGDISLILTRANIPRGASPVLFSPDFHRDGKVYGYGAAGARIYISRDRGKTWEIISIPQRRSSLSGRLLDAGRLVKAWVPVMIWRTKVFLSKTRPFEEAGIAIALLMVVFILFLAGRGLKRR